MRATFDVGDSGRVSLALSVYEPEVPEEDSYYLHLFFRSLSSDGAIPLG